MPAATVSTSTSTASQMLAISFMNEIFVAKNALAAYLIISLVRTFVTTIGALSGR